MEQLNTLHEQVSEAEKQDFERTLIKEIFDVSFNCNFSKLFKGTGKKETS